MARFDGSAVVVTGTASGIGQATARRFGQEGGRVLCIDIDGDGAEKTAIDVRSAGGDAHAVPCDVADPASVRAAIDEAVQRFGRIDVVANVAGIGRFVHSIDETLESWSRTIAVNLTGTFLVTQAALPHLLESRGAVVNVASTAGLKGQPWSAAYAASKGGVVMLTRSLAVEYGDRGVRINCVCPGGVRTNIIQNFIPPEGANLKVMARLLALDEDFCDPDDIASAIAFLASPEAWRCNGTILRVDGGMLA